jgi:hypothetical protein
MTQSASMTEKPDKTETILTVLLAVAVFLLGILVGIPLGYFLCASEYYGRLGQAAEIATISEASIPVMQEVMLAVKDECTVLLGVTCPYWASQSKGNCLTSFDIQLIKSPMDAAIPGSCGESAWYGNINKHFRE